MGSVERCDLENAGEIVTTKTLVRTRSQADVLSALRCRFFKMFLANVAQVVFGTKLFVLLPAIPMVFVAQYYNFPTPWVFGLSLVGLTPLAERVSFLTEQIAYFTGPTVGGLLNATCGNATELIIAMLALRKRKIHVLKYSLLGSVISNLLLVLGSSLLCGGLANLNKEQPFDGKQADVNSMLLLLGLLCHILPLLFKHGDVEAASASVLKSSRASSIVMLLAYAAYILFQLKTHTQLSQTQEEKGDDDDEVVEETAAIGFWSAFAWLFAMTVTIAILSEYVVGTIEGVSDTWGISVSFISIILLPIVGNAAEHAGSIIFAFKNKLDISLGVAMGSASQISMFAVPLCVIVAWIMGIPMDLDFGLLETGCLAFSILLTALILQDGSSHYMKGVILTLAYVVIGACFFVQHIPIPINHSSANDVGNSSILGKLGHSIG